MSMRPLSLAAAILLAQALSACAAPPAAPTPPATVQPPPAATAPKPADRPATTIAACDWSALASADHRDRIQTPLQPMVLLVDRMSSASGVDAASRQAVLDLLRRAERPMRLGDIAGDWKVRSIQVHGADSPPGFDFAFAYPYFKAVIQRTGACGYRFAKTTGSQRRTGNLYPMHGSNDELAFLGAQTVNDDPVRNYDPAGDAEHASVGRLLRTGPDELLLLLDAEPDRFELYQLRRP